MKIPTAFESQSTAYCLGAEHSLTLCRHKIPERDPGGETST